jgi:hypothetical protein
MSPRDETILWAGVGPFEGTVIRQCLVDWVRAYEVLDLSVTPTTPEHEALIQEYFNLNHIECILGWGRVTANALKDIKRAKQVHRDLAERMLEIFGVPMDSVRVCVEPPVLPRENARTVFDSEDPTTWWDLADDPQSRLVLYSQMYPGYGREREISFARSLDMPTSEELFNQAPS